MKLNILSRLQGATVVDSTTTRTNEEVVLLSLCAVSIPSILPFGIYRLVQHSWAAGALDIAVVGGMAAVMAYVYRTRRLRAASVLVALVYSVGMVLAVHLKGVNLAYWAYPTMIAAFFTLRPNKALLINMGSLACLMATLAGQVSMVTLFTLGMTLILINLFSYIVFFRTRLQFDALHLKAERDFLTGAGNRGALQKSLEECAASPAQTGLLLLDLDHFKQINDRFGHGVGDIILIEFCKLIRSRIRTSDQLFRYGGEEFVIIAHGASLTAATRLAEDLRALIERSTLYKGCSVTVSIGVATQNGIESPAAWLQRADQLLYAAKSAGRNRVQAAAT